MNFTKEEISKIYSTDLLTNEDYEIISKNFEDYELVDMETDTTFYEDIEDLALNQYYEKDELRGLLRLLIDNAQFNPTLSLTAEEWLVDERVTKLTNGKYIIDYNG